MNQDKNTQNFYGPVKNVAQHVEEKYSGPVYNGNAGDNGVGISFGAEPLQKATTDESKNKGVPEAVVKAGVGAFVSEGIKEAIKHLVK